MLTYQYRCESCEQNFEVEQSIKDDAFSECPFCEVGELTRLINSSGSFVLKGGGWHADLYSSARKKDE